MYKPLVSIVIPYYNGEKYIDHCLKSVYNQTYDNYEIIVVDDCSSRDQGDYFKKYNGCMRYHKLSENHGRPSPAKNYGARQAKGELIAFLDQDDWWEPDKLEKQVALFSNPDIGLVASNAYLYDDMKQAKLGKVYAGFTECTSRDDIRRRLFCCNFIVSCTSMVRKKCFIDAGCFDESYATADDYDLWYKMSKISTIHVIDEPLATHRVSPCSISGCKREAVLEDRIYFYRKYFDDDNGVDEVEKRNLLATYYNQLAIYLSLEGRYKEARKHVLKATNVMNRKTRLYYFITYMPYMSRLVPKLKNRFKFRYNPLYVNW
jgi:glycosyltransferase involved in cell wall biosynthesis